MALARRGEAVQEGVEAAQCRATYPLAHSTPDDASYHSPYEGADHRHRYGDGANLRPRYNPRAQASQDSYSNPAGSIYHAPGAVPSEAQLEGQAVAATLGADGVQIANLVLDEGTSSYSPAAIKVKKGVPVRLNLSNTNGGRDCRSVVDIPALGARGFIDGSAANTMDFTPTQAGVYEFNCPMRMVNPSYLVVTN